MRQSNIDLNSCTQDVMGIMGWVVCDIDKIHTQARPYILRY